MPGLNVIALISGGKDSLFSILHCQAQGHRVVALANLYPAGSEEEDTDSYMFQTIGHDIIPLYGEALELPLYRAPIHGQAVSRSQTYRQDDPAGSQADEIESLVPLLEEVLGHHPEANAVSTGAILSTYQRTRIESVALRLKLIPLAYLWQFPFLPPYKQSSLLEDMAAVGQDARVIKVASGGLDERHLWLNVADPATVAKLGRDMSRFGGGEVGAVLGEGGEYESLAIDGPASLWKGAIEVTEQDREVVSSDGGTAVVRVLKGSVTRKLDLPSNEQDDLAHLRHPPLWDTECEEVRDFTLWQQHMFPNPPSHDYALTTMSSFPACRATIQKRDITLHISNITAATASSAREQMALICEEIKMSLAEHHIAPQSIAFTTILLRSMGDFPTINAAYSQLFKGPNPPARVTIGCGNQLPDGVLVMVSVIAHTWKQEQRRALHVQSRSYWAPANIGPYSQAVAVPFRGHPETADAPEIVYVAGQIPLIPATMEVILGGFVQQAAISLQHLWRIGRVMGVQWWANVVVYITATSVAEARERAMIASNMWRKMHDRSSPGEAEDGAEDPDIDVGDRSLRRPWNGQASAGQDINKTPRPPLPDWECLRPGSLTYNVGEGTPQCAVVQVAELPRGALIEWASIGLVTGGAHIDLNDGRYGPHVRADSLSMTMMPRYDFIRGGQLANDGSAFDDLFTTHSPHFLKGAVIPCKAIFDMDGQHHEAFQRSRRFDPDFEPESFFSIRDEES